MSPAWATTLSSSNRPLPKTTLSFCHPEWLTCLSASQGWNELGDIGSLRHTSALSLGDSPLPFNNPLLFVIPSEARNLRCASIPPRFPRANIPPIPTEPICPQTPLFLSPDTFCSLGAKPRDLRCAIRVSRPYRATTSANHRRILMKH